MRGMRSVLTVGIAAVALAACGSESTDSGAATSSEESAPRATDAAAPETAAAEPATTAAEPIATDSPPPATDAPAATTAPTTEATTTTTTTTTVPAPESASYRITVVQEWSAETHPQTLPNDPHLSPTVLAIHDAAGTLVPVGASASAGIEEMAEVGRTGVLVSELEAAGAADVQVGQRVDVGGSDEFEVTVNQSAPLLSLVTMLAPSPDWFVGAADVALFANGAWLESAELDFVNWDAGTDSGPDFTSGNSDTQPRGVITGPADQAFVDALAEGRFGVVRIERTG